MAILSSLKGWRRAALLNTVAVFIFTCLSVGLLAWSSSRAGGVGNNFIFFEGSCETTHTRNLWLHLLLNVCSTGVLASSNFFMQVLSSPSRSEVNAAHSRKTALDIGVPSFSNLFHVAGFKAVAWLLLFASSIPIHLFFNSAIFSTEFQGASWHMTMASKGFANSAQYFPPGAILWPAGGGESSGGYLDEGYGAVVNTTTYFDAASSVVKGITFAAESSSNWKRIEVPECLSQYLYCSSRTKYGDVVLVVQSHNATGGFMASPDESLGWTRNNMFVTLDLNQGSFWDSHVPGASTNSLWFAANCSTKSDLNPRTHRAEGCFQTCNNAFGKRESGFGAMSRDKIPPDYTFDFFHYGGIDYLFYSLGLPQLVDPSASILDLNYCLVQEIDPGFWIRSYVLFAAVIIFLAAMFGSAQKSNPIASSKQTLEQSATNGILNTDGSTGGQLLPSVITANLPQLLLSFSYFVYNSLYTRLCVEKEWNSYSIGYRGLRVTQPKGQQRSTYRLQLPYRYSIPLITISILLHWLVSNALYVFVLEGGYYSVESYGEPIPEAAVVGTGLSDDAYVGIGYSTMALLALFLIACVLAVIPFVICSRRIKGPMVLGASNSLVISAACHVPVPEQVPSSVEIKTKQGNEYQQVSMKDPERTAVALETPNSREVTERGSYEMQHLLGPETTSTAASGTIPSASDEEEENDDKSYTLSQVTTVPLRWGVVKMPASFYEQYAYLDSRIGHLSFGAKEHGVEEPVDGHWYI
ncbi:hypothetical protein NKR23_g3661 [Pleurostoma richardsiae]|uniref:DUF6536 domain-containing protein n=1 Tax=Pleurostoma richardsiae TaxID=41990 RepID=A0AA38VWC7_9PEZI|nr:hypothetical protein NKR23_g3661 [Pleurostoma richardsiae]